VLDSTKLGYDAGYYVSVLPWLAAIQNRTLILVVAALGIVALLYGVIGSLRIRRGRIRASDHARAHLGVLLGCLALAIAWGAALGFVDIEPSAPPPFPSGEAAVRAMPLWDPAYVGAALGVPATAIALRPPPQRKEDRGVVWMIAPTNAPGPVRLAVETDTGL